MNESPQDLAERFAAFVAQQPPERPIDHSGSWGACAVGEFVREALNQPQETQEAFAFDLAISFRHFYGWWTPVIMRMTGNLNNPFPTYGDLHAALDAAQWAKEGESE